MPVTPTYPGIYIEEILSNSHSITAAPTSVTVFVGYTHPFKTRAQNYGEADRDLLVSPTTNASSAACSTSAGSSDDVGRAVFQFFANGGAVAYVVALQPQFHPFGGGADRTADPRAEPDPGRRHGRHRVQRPRTRRCPPSAHGLDHQPEADDPPTRSAARPLDVADVTITYGDRAETFRRVTLNASPPAADAGNTLEQRIGTEGQPPFRPW